jgi:aspartyl-tRNA(Asn)/glutamyl-tRNA(Gln) amidotransferase subunit A
MTSAEPAYWTIAEASEALRRRAVSAPELTSTILGRIDAVDGRLGSYLTVARERAHSEAAGAQARLDDPADGGGLLGIPVAVKDVFATRGLRTTAGSALLASWTPAEDADVVSRLRAAGAVLVGKHALHEFAFGPATLDALFPTGRNPWHPGRVPGGSSSGSAAAVAAGLCFAAIGSDTGGSVRKPAALCGVVGFKPTAGRVSQRGMIPLSSSLDNVGIFTRTVDDCARILHAIADDDHGGAALPPDAADLDVDLAGRRIGFAPGWLDDENGTEQPVADAFLDALRVFESGGARLVELDEEALVAARAINTLIVAAEAYAYHEPTLRSHPEGYGPSLRSRLRQGAFITSADYIHARAARARLTAEIETLLSELDVIVSPSSPGVAEPFDEVDQAARYNAPSFTNPFNLAGLPAVSVPCGFSPDGLPIGLQIGGRRDTDRAVLAVARAYERATRWHERHPPV